MPKIILKEHQKHLAAGCHTGLIGQLKKSSGSAINETNNYSDSDKNLKKTMRLKARKALE
jgi:hypothetical protein